MDCHFISHPDFLVYFLPASIWRVNIFSVTLFTMAVESGRSHTWGLRYTSTKGCFYKTLTVYKSDMTWTQRTTSPDRFQQVYIVGKATSSFSGNPLWAHPRKHLILAKRSRSDHPRKQKLIFVRMLLSSSGGWGLCLITFSYYKCFLSVTPYFSRRVGQLYFCSKSCFLPVPQEFSDCGL